MSTLTPEPPEATEETEQVEVQDMTETAGDTTTTLVRGTDRCDRCGAEAFVRTRHPLGRHATGDATESDLLWCGHHYQAFPSLQNFVVADERNRLDVKIVSSY